MPFRLSERLFGHYGPQGVPSVSNTPGGRYPAVTWKHLSGTADESHFDTAVAYATFEDLAYDPYLF